MRFDFSDVWKKISTHLTLIAASCTAAGLYFATMPSEWKGGVAAGFGQLILVAGLIATLAVPFATSYKQKSLEK